MTKGLRIAIIVVWALAVLAIVGGSLLAAYMYDDTTMGVRPPI
jgi:hypothetical protein